MADGHTEIKKLQILEVEGTEGTKIPLFDASGKLVNWVNKSTLSTTTTETDPTVPAHVKSITTTNIENWNTASSWSDHSGKYYPRTPTNTSTSIDCNTASDGIITGNVWTNGPPVTGIGSLKTIRYSQDWIEQTYVHINAEIKIYSRVRHTGTTWTTWVKTWTSGDSSTLSFEPAFSKNTGFNKAFGNVANTVTQGNDSRLSDARTPLAHSHTFSTITSLPTTLSGYGIIDAEPAFTKKSGFNKDFGTAAGTVVEGNDQRLIDGSEALTKLNELKLGARNYYGRSTKIEDSYVSTLNRFDAFAPNGFSINVSDLTNNEIKLKNTITENGPWIISFYFKTDQPSALTFKVGVNSVFMPTSTTSSDMSWQKYSRKITVTDWTSVLNYVKFKFDSLQSYYIKDIKIEKGNLASDWSSNPDDEDVFQLSITTAVNISSSTLINTFKQNGRNVNINNGANNITYTINDAITSTFMKTGSGSITFSQGNGRTMVQMSGTAIMNGIPGSNAKIVSEGTTDYLYINNY